MASLTGLFDDLIPGGVAAHSPTPEASVEGPKYTAGLATAFGYRDPDDNGEGAWGDVTASPNIMGASLPIEELRRHFGDEDRARAGFVEVRNPANGKKVIVPILDKGPADWVIDRQGATIDLTHAANEAIGGTGKTPVEYRILDTLPEDALPQPTKAGSTGLFDDLKPGAQKSMQQQSESQGVADIKPTGKSLTGLFDDLMPDANSAPAVERPPRRGWLETLGREFAASAAQATAKTIGGGARIVAAGTPSLADKTAKANAELATRAAEIQKRLDDPEAHYSGWLGFFTGAPTDREDDEERLARIKQQIADNKDYLKIAQAQEPNAAQKFAADTMKKFEGAAGDLADLMDASAKEAPEVYGTVPKDDSIPAQVGRGAGNVFAMAPAMAAGGAGLPIAALQGASQSYADAYDSTAQHLRNAGVTDEKTIEDASHQAASSAAVKTLPALGAYLVGGKLASEAVARLLPKASPIIKGLAGGTAATGANITASAGIRAVNGQPILPNAENFTQDAMFGLTHGYSTGRRAAGERDAGIVFDELAGKKSSSKPAMPVRTENGRAPIVEETPESYDFIEHSPGRLDWGAITPEMASQANGPLDPGEIRIQQGAHFADGTGFGWIHAHDHESAIQKSGWQSVKDYLADTLSHFDQIWRQPNGRLLLVKRGDKRHQTAVVEMQPSDGFYGLTTAYLERASKDFSKKNVLVWERSEPATGEPGKPAAPSSPASSQGSSEESVAHGAPNQQNQSTLAGERVNAESEPELSNDWTTASEAGSPIPPDKEGPKAGIVFDPRLVRTMAAVRALGGNVKNFIQKLPTWNHFRSALLDWSARNQKSAEEIQRLHNEITRAVPNAIRRAGITNWIQAGGDETLLRARAAVTKNLDLRRGYEAAANLTDAEKAIAQKIKQTYDILLKRAAHYGIDLNEVPDYVNQVWDMGPLNGIVTTSPKRLNDFFRFSRERVFGSYFEGEQAGYKPRTKDIAKLLAIYTNEMNNVINSRRFVENLSKGKASDGRPLLSPRGGMQTVGDDNSKAYLVFPDMSKTDAKDYKVLDQPALRDWRWRGKDDAGNPIFVQGDLAVHPEIANHLKNVLGSSRIRAWWNDRSGDNPFLNMTKATAKFLLDDLQGYAKGTMLSFSPFHQVQEGIHAVGHRVNPLSVPKIDMRNPAQMDAARHGLMLHHDRVSQQYFQEGVGSNNRNLVTLAMRAHGGKIGEAAANKIDAYQDWLFGRYIPGLKFKTYEHMVERNKARFAKELASGSVSLDQIKYLSAQQANAAYGHLNYADMGRNPTAQHLFQIVALAPDFLEARARFVAQAAKNLTGSKNGAEQLQALAFLALTQFIGARIFNQLNNGDPEWDHPFEVRVGNKFYGVRSVPEDLYKLSHDWTAFVGGRISPIFGRFVQEGIFHTNWRGEPTTAGDAIRDIVAETVPLPFRALTRQWTKSDRANPISPFEQVLTATGIQVHRYSPISEIYPLAKDWKKKNLPTDAANAVYPVSKYTQLRYALEDGDRDSARVEVKRMLDSGTPIKKVTDGFRSSLFTPFTGSGDNDIKFYNSLKPDQQEMFKAAMKRRTEIMRRFNQFILQP